MALAARPTVGLNTKSPVPQGPLILHQPCGLLVRTEGLFALSPHAESNNSMSCTSISCRREQRRAGTPAKSLHVVRRHNQSSACYPRPVAQTGMALEFHVLFVRKDTCQLSGEHLSGVREHRGHCFGMPLLLLADTEYTC